MPIFLSSFCNSPTNTRTSATQGPAFTPNSSSQVDNNCVYLGTLGAHSPILPSRHPSLLFMFVTHCALVYVSPILTSAHFFFFLLSLSFYGRRKLVKGIHRNTTLTLSKHTQRSSTLSPFPPFLRFQFLQPYCIFALRSKLDMKIGERERARKPIRKRWRGDGIVDKRKGTMKEWQRKPIVDVRPQPNIVHMHI